MTKIVTEIDGVPMSRQEVLAELEQAVADGRHTWAEKKPREGLWSQLQGLRCKERGEFPGGVCEHAVPKIWKCERCGR